MNVMRRILSISVFLLMGCATLVSQNPLDEITFSEGAEMIVPPSGQIPRIFGWDDSGYYALGFDYRYYLEHFNRDFISTNENYIILHRGWRTRDLEAVFWFHGKIYLFTSEQRIKRQILYVQSVDPKNLRQFDDERKVMEVENLKGWQADFYFRLSRKEDKLVVYSQLDAYSRNIQDLNFQMYGKDMVLEWEAKDRVVYERRSPRESTVKVSDEGNVFIMSLLDDQNLLSLFNETKNRYFLLAVTDSGKVINHYPVDFPELYIRGFQIEPGKNHDLSCVGFYSPTHFRTYIDGIFYFELDNSNSSIENLRFHEIEPYFLNEAMNIAEYKESEEMYNFYISHLIMRDNNTFIMLAENQNNQNYENYMNIMAASFSPGGNLNWKRIIPKQQSHDTLSGFNYASYGVHAPWYNDKVTLVFNDNPKNGLWPGEKKTYTFHSNDKAVLKSVGIGPSGELSTSIIYRKTRKRMKTPLPMACYDPLNNEMIIPALRYRKLSFFKIGF